jgi:2,3-dihydroxybenzoate-AMP ligase
MLQVGGARLAPATARRVRPAFRCRLQQVFGMAEGLVCYTRHEDPDELACTTQGLPISSLDELRLVDETGRVVPEGEPGMLETRGPYTIRAYYRDADPGAFTADGFYRTGDIVRRLPSGHVVVEGRAKDQINRGGEKIAPDEVERHLLAHPLVHDAALVALPDERLGERTCAVLVVRDGAVLAAPEVRRWLRLRGVATFKLPDRVETVPAFPRTGVGKVSRRALRAELAAALTPTTPQEPR